MNNDFKNDDIRDLIIERDGYLEQVKELEQELQRKDNIINELKEELKEARKELQPGELIIGQGLIDNILDKIKELEEK